MLIISPASIKLFRSNFEEAQGRGRGQFGIFSTQLVDYSVKFGRDFDFDGVERGGASKNEQGAAEGLGRAIRL